jgi:hypothetical protein
MVNESKKAEISQYKMAYTACSLVASETIKVAQLYIEKKDWKEVSRYAFENNVLQYRTENALKRTLSEIVSRLKVISEDAIELLVSGTTYEQNQILWFMTCVRYEFIYDFAIEVIKEKYNLMQPEVTQLDYDAFFNSKLNWHEELDKLTDNTRYKLKQILFKMLREAEIVDANNCIMTTFVSPRVQEIIKNYDMNYLNIFPN